MSLKECLKHIPQIPVQEIEKFALDEVFKFNRYIFTTRRGKQQYGYCTYCHKDFSTLGWRHGSEVTCPECGSWCTVKASGVGRKTLVNEAYFTYYLKSAIDPQAIAAIGIYAVRDFSGRYRGVRTQYIIKSMYIFQPGIGGTAFHRWWAYYSQARTIEAGDFKRAKSVKCQFKYGHNANIITDYSRESIAAAVAGTPYQYSTWEHYTIGDMTDFFDLYSRYPCVEYLTKLGFSNLVAEKLQGGRTYSAINWRGKSLLQVLKMSKAELAEIRSHKINVTFEFLRFFQLSKKDGSNMTPLEIENICRLGNYFDYLKVALNYTTLRKAIKFLQNQHNKYPKHFDSKVSALITWKDYIADCKKLQLDLTRESVLFPRNLYTAHQNTIKQVKIKADEELNKQIKARAKILHKKFYFEHGGLFIRPAQNTHELIAEGKALDHCVGTYANRYAGKETVLLFIRDMAEPDKPYFTVEVWNGKITQVRGFKNCGPDERVEEFIEAFKAEKLKRKARVRMSA